MKQNAGFLAPVRLGQAPSIGTPQTVVVQLFEKNGPPIYDQRIEVTYLGTSGSGGMDRRTDLSGTAVVEVPNGTTVVMVRPFPRAGREWEPRSIEAPVSPGVATQVVFSAVPYAAATVPEVPSPAPAPAPSNTALLVGGVAALGLLGYWMLK